MFQALKIQMHDQFENNMECTKSTEMCKNGTKLFEKFEKTNLTIRHNVKANRTIIHNFITFKIQS